ncbi:MAG: AAA family ATPase, partial [Myxococcota bacterium]
MHTPQFPHPAQQTQATTQALQQQIQHTHQQLHHLLQEVGRVIVGQQSLLERMVVGLLTGGHLLLEGVPGLAKTLTVQTLASCLSLQFQRIQFTPDLLPSDLLGTLIYQPQTGNFQPKLGPLFHNLILADEINRAPAKVQSALLEAMQEKQVTLGETTYPLPKPFFVMATQNPVEQEGTYTLPEAQLDRFLFKLMLTYPSKQEERQIMDRMVEAPPSPPQAVLSPEFLLHCQHMLPQIHVADQIKEYILEIIFCTRDPQQSPLPDQPEPLSQPLHRYLSYGASPRATLALNRAARAFALLHGRSYVIPDDIKAIALDVLR